MATNVHKRMTNRYKKGLKHVYFDGISHEVKKFAGRQQKKFKNEYEEG